MAERSSSPHPTQRRYPPELRERAVRLVREVATEQGERHGAVTRVAKSLGIGSESVRLWVRQAEINDGERTGLTTAERARIKELERDNREVAAGQRDPHERAATSGLVVDACTARGRDAARHRRALP